MQAEEILDPATGEVLPRVPEPRRRRGGPGGAAGGGRLPGLAAHHAHRARHELLKLADLVEKAAELARLESSNCGKPYLAALKDEIPAIADVFRFFAGAARCVPGIATGEYAADYTSMVRRDPVGVVASIAPWNYPLMMAAWKLGPAVAAGNTVVLKPSEQTPLTTLKLGSSRGPLPAGAVTSSLRGGDVGAARAQHPRCAWCRSRATCPPGRDPPVPRPGRVKRTHLESGRQGARHRLRRRGLAAVVSGIRFVGFYNAGQDCTAACRIYAGAKVYDRLVADLTRAVSSIRWAGRATGWRWGRSSRERARRVAGFVPRASQQKHIEITAAGRAGPRAASSTRPRWWRGEAGRRDRPPRGVRPGGLGDALRGSGAGDRLGE